MKRRAFFQTLAASVAAISCGQILIPQTADAYRWKRTGQWLIVPNDEYINAPYEMAIIAPFDWAKFIFEEGEKPDIQMYSRAMGPVLGMIPYSFPQRFATPTGPSIPPYKKKFVTEPHYSL